MTGTSLDVSSDISVSCKPLRWAGTCMDNQPPCSIRKGEERRKKKEKFYIYLILFRCYTHTHPAGAGSTLKGKRKKKADTDDGQQAETAQGGKGTNGPPEPTYAEKRTWQKTEHTPKPHDTLRRGTGGELGTKWGTSWWQARKTKTINLKKDSVPPILEVVRYSPSGP